MSNELKTFDSRGGFSVNGNTAIDANTNLTANSITANANISAVNGQFTGNLTVGGNLVYANTTTLVVSDPVIQIGGGANGAPLTTDDGMDRGLYMHTFDNGANAEIDRFVGWSHADQQFIMASNVDFSANNVVNVNSYGNLRAQNFIGEVVGNVSGSASSATTAATAYSVSGANVSGEVANANYASYANVAATANSVAGANVSGTVANANYSAFSGVAATANSVAAANVTGTVANANYSAFAGTVTGASQSNITSVGTLTGLTVNGTANLGAIGNVKITGGSANNVIITDGNSNLSWVSASAVSAYKYSKEWHVDPVNGNDTTGNGSEANPYATIAKALATMSVGTGEALFLHHGVYSENVTFNKLNVDVMGDGRGGAYQTGTWTITSNSNVASSRFYGLHFTSNVNITGNAAVYFDSISMSANCNVNKSGTGLVNFNDVMADGAPLIITGNGFITSTVSRHGPVSIGAANATVTFRDSPSVYSATVTAGVLVVDNSYVFATSNTGNAITTSAGTITYLRNSSIAAANGAAGRMSLAGFWTVDNMTFDLANSALTGTNLTTIAYFDALNSRGTITAVGNVTGGNLITAGVANVSGNLNALGNLNVTGRSNLNAVGNVTITGGSNGQFLQTNGSGVLSWANATSTYGDSNVTTLLSSFGSNTITTTGNISGGNILASGTSSTVVRRAFGLVAADTYVQLDDIRARVTSATSQLSLILASGSWQGTGWTETYTSGASSISNWVNLPLSTGFDTASGAMTSQGNGCKCVISDQTPSAKVYEITVVRSGTTGNMWNISITRLV